MVIQYLLVYLKKESWVNLFPLQRAPLHKLEKAACQSYNVASELPVNTCMHSVLRKCCYLPSLSLLPKGWERQRKEEDLVLFEYDCLI